MLFEVFPNVSPVLLLVFKPFPKVCIDRWIRALMDFGVLFLGFTDLFFLFLLNLHLVCFSLINDTHCLQIFNIKSWLLLYFEKVFKIFLLELVFLILNPLMQPIWILDCWYWIHALLKSCGNRNNLLNCSTKSFFVVIPIKNRSNIEVFH